MLKAGFAFNVIPSEAEAYIDIRALPDEDMPRFYDEMRALIADPHVEIEPRPPDRPATPPSRTDTVMFRALEHAQRKMFPKAITLPADADRRHRHGPACAPKACRPTASAPSWKPATRAKPTPTTKGWPIGVALQAGRVPLVYDFGSRDVEVDRGAGTRDCRDGTHAIAGARSAPTRRQEWRRSSDLETNPALTSGHSRTCTWLAIMTNAPS
jgi:hypothetical protein